MPAGSLLHLRFGAANVDEEEFACPFDLDLDREGVTRHVAFSTGPRVCPGANLSRVEQQIAWGVLLDRLESIEYGDGNDWLHQPGIMLGTLKLNLRFTKAADAAVARDGPDDQRVLIRPAGDHPRPDRYVAGMILTADDRLDIAELPGRYADALDRLQPDRLRDVFTTDAVWEMVGGIRLDGLEAIMEFMGRPDVHPGAHLMTNIYIEAVSDDPRDGGPLVHLCSRGVYPVGPSDPRNPTACSTDATTTMSCAPTPAGVSGIGDTSTARSSRPQPAAHDLRLSAAHRARPAS